MCNKDFSGGKFYNFSGNHVKTGRLRNHRIGYSRQFSNAVRNIYFGVNERLKNIGYAVSIKRNDGNFSNFSKFVKISCCFYVNYCKHVKKSIYLYQSL